MSISYGNLVEYLTPTNKVDKRVSVGVREYLSVIALEIALLNVVNVTKLVLNVTVNVITKGLVQIKNNLLFPFLF